MLRLERLLCPVDLSDTSRRALEHAGALARWCRAHLVVIHVAPPFVPPTPGITPVPPAPPPALVLLDPAVREPLARQLEEFVAPLRQAGIEVRVDLVEGPVVDEILKQASELQGDLIVIGTAGLGGLKRLLLGSVAEPVVRRAPCPVMTVPAAAAGLRPDEPVLFERIVCGIDFSETSLRALDYALSLAQEARARLTLLHVLEGPAASPDIHFDMGVDRRRQEEEALARLRRLRPAGVEDWAEVEEHVVAGRPHEAILHVAQAIGVDLIVIGAHGHRRHLVEFGSTTNHVVRHAPCPVLCVRARR
jgi:nucleotide-binding universal stress UspA family protein